MCNMFVSYVFIVFFTGRTWLCQQFIESNLLALYGISKSNKKNAKVIRNWFICKKLKHALKMCFINGSPPT